jgi:uncharacterized repeat protein (TIGR02543 family)
VTGNIKLYAGWTRISHKVTFNPNNDKPASTATVYYGDPAKRPANPEWAGNTFVDWYDNSEFSGAPYDFNTPVKKDFTLYAKWTTVTLGLKSEIAYDSATKSDKLVLKFSYAVTTSAAITADGYSVGDWTEDGTAAIKNDAAGDAIATVTLAGDGKSATVEPSSTGGTIIPALTFTTADGTGSITSSQNTLYRADDEATRDYLKTKSTHVLFADAARPFAQIAYTETEDSTTQTQKWVHFGTETDDTYILNVLRAVYLPNAADTTDAVETGKTTIKYTPDISKTALGLFEIKIGDSQANDKINVKGTDLPVASGQSNINLIVIDIGRPEANADNGALPTYYIPTKGLGASANNTTYPHVRLRVNDGASLVIEADNSAYTTVGTDGKIAGAGHPCEAGNFRNGCVEVMAGGKLRDGAYEGFPLGANAVLLNRVNSYLAVGPESSFTSETKGYDGNRDKWYEGWLIGPSAGNPRIAWGTGDQGSGYIEVRPGKLAISANVTVKRTLGLIYNVWFVNGPTVTIDAKDDSLTVDIGQDSAKVSMTGLFSNETESTKYRFYGTADTSGGQNTGNPAAKIVIQPGSTLDGRFLTSTIAEGTSPFITVQTGESATAKTITNLGAGTGDDTVESVQYESGISGYLNWDWPEAEE